METKEYKAVPYNRKWIFVDEKIMPTKGEIALLDWEGNNNEADFRIGKVHSISENKIDMTNQFGNISICKRDIDERWKNAKWYKVTVQEYGCGIEGVPCVLLSDEEDVEALAAEAYIEFPSNSKDHPEYTYGRDVNVHRKRKAFIKGYKAAKAKGGYSEEQVRKAIAEAVVRGIESKHDSVGVHAANGLTWIDEIIASLKPVVQSICIEMEWENQMQKGNQEYGEYKPASYTKEIDGQPVEFLKCEVNYEQ